MVTSVSMAPQVRLADNIDGPHLAICFANGFTLTIHRRRPVSLSGFQNLNHTRIWSEHLSETCCFTDASKDRERATHARIWSYEAQDGQSVPRGLSSDFPGCGDFSSHACATPPREGRIEILTWPWQTLRQRSSGRRMKSTEWA